MVRSRSQPKPMAELLERYLAASGLKEVSRAQRLRGAWKAAVPSEVFEATCLMKLRNAVLFVGVRSSALLFELDGFRKPEILDRLRDASRDYVRDIVFKLVRDTGRNAHDT